MIDRSIEEMLDSPVFIVGAPRSGTTWLQRLLLEHPVICGGQESNFFKPVEVALDDYDACKDMKRKIGMPTYWRERDLIEWYRGFWRETMRKSIATQAPQLLVEKSPMHSTMMATITRVLPQARFVHMLRDSRAVVASLRAASRAEWGREWAPKRTRSRARLWHRFNEAALHDGQTLGSDRYTQVRYEQCRAEPHAALAKLLTWLGVDWTGDLINRCIERQRFERQRASGGSTLGQTECAEPAGFFRRGETNSWQRELNVFQRALIWRVTGKLMRDLGYRRDGSFDSSAPADADVEVKWRLGAAETSAVGSSAHRAG